MLARTHRDVRPTFAPREQARIERGQEPSGDGRGLAAPGSAHDSQETGSNRACRELAHQPLAAEEVRRVARFELRQPLVGTDLRRRHIPATDRVETTELQRDRVVRELEVRSVALTPRCQELRSRRKATARLGACPLADQLVHPAGHTVGGSRERFDRRLGFGVADVQADDPSDVVELERRKHAMTVAPLICTLDQ